MEPTTATGDSGKEETTNKRKREKPTTASSPTTPPEVPTRPKRAKASTSTFATKNNDTSGKDSFTGPFASEHAEIIQSRTAALQAYAAQGRHHQTKHWPQTEADILRALRRKYPEHSQKQLASEYLQMLLPDGDWKPSETQVLNKIANEMRKS